MAEASQDKSEIKKQIGALGGQIAEALKAGDAAQAKRLRRRKRHLKAATRRLAAARKKSPPAVEAAPAPPAS
jgi:hypothetical protein